MCSILNILENATEYHLCLYRKCESHISVPVDICNTICSSENLSIQHVHHQEHWYSYTLIQWDIVMITLTWASKLSYLYTHFPASVFAPHHNHVKFEIPINCINLFQLAFYSYQQGFYSLAFILTHKSSVFILTTLKSLVRIGSEQICIFLDLGHKPLKKLTKIWSTAFRVSPMILSF